MNRIFFVAIVVLSVLAFTNMSTFASNKVIVTSQDKVNGYVIVQKGWTLSAIAEAVFGDYKRYPELAEFNGIEDPNLINVGQKIYIRPRITKQNKFEIAAGVVKKHIERSFWSKHRRKYDWNVSRRWAFEPLSLISNDSPTGLVKICFREIERRLEWHDAVEIYGAIYSLSTSADEMMYFTALIEAESNFRNVNGSHGEIGPCQIKPATGYSVYRKLFEDISMDEINSVLENVANNLEIGYLLLKSYGNDKIKALERYNAGSNKRAYAMNVMRKYHRLMRKLDESIQAQLTK